MEKNTMIAQSRSLNPGWRLPQGELLRRALRSNPTNEYLLYRPSGASIDSPLLVVVLGVSRHWEQQAAAFIPACERLGVTLLSPGMGGSAHEGYRSIGRQGNRADVFLHDCLREVTLLTGLDATRFRLFGHSSGAQFAHRYLMAHPHRVESAVIAGARWYTFPDTHRKFPYGIRSTKRLPDLAFNPEQYLRVPVTVLDGTLDTKKEVFRNSEMISAWQGEHRLARARHWVAAMRKQAQAHDMPSMVELVEIEGISHLFGPFCREGRLVQRVFWSLFGATVDEESMTSTCQ
jgi:pimeloyl-ACP methyl ester carboxylesterase